MNKFITLMAVLRRKAHLPAVALLALMSGLSAKADVVIDATTFPDANFRNLINIGYAGGDGVLTDAEIANVTRINCTSSRIASLKGIEYLTALEVLFCDNNQLTSLDVSKNTALTKLNCGYNQLTSLDVSKNTALKTLMCHYNQLTTLDLSNNPVLDHLMCQYNQLTELDFSNNPLNYNLNYHDQTRTLIAETAVTPDGERYYYLRLDDNVNGDKSIVERMTETNVGGVASKFDPSRVREWTSGGTVSDGILLLTDVTEDPNTNIATGTVKYKYITNNSYFDYDGSAGDFTLKWTAPMPEIPGPTSIEMNENLIRLQLTQSYQLEVVTPNAGEITWTSSNPEAVEVDSTGRITALKNGTAIITATTSNGVAAWCGVWSYLLGDLNEDDKVDISDLNTEVSIVLGN